jgi:F0F1-type ATP synthase assembly protein I
MHVDSCVHKVWSMIIITIIIIMICTATVLRSATVIFCT